MPTTRLQSGYKSGSWSSTDTWGNEKKIEHPFTFSFIKSYTKIEDKEGKRGCTKVLHSSTEARGEATPVE